MEDEKEIDLRELFDVIKKRILMIIIAALLFTFIAAVVSVFFIKPTYESSVGIIVSKQAGEKITSQDVTMYQNLMQTYKEIASTNNVARKAADKIGGGLDPKDLLKRTKITAKTGNMIINITVESKTAAECYKEVQAYAAAFVATAAELIPEGDIKIMDNAEYPLSPVKPNVNLNIAIGFLAGLLLSTGTAFLLEFMNNTIVLKEDVEKYLGLGVLGIIPENDLE